MCKLDNAANKTNIAFFISSNNFYRANVAKVERKNNQACLDLFCRDASPRRLAAINKIRESFV